MSILVSKEILNAIYSELSSAQKSVQMISAFCKLDALKNLEFHINPCVLEKKILVRFRLSDLISGATDFKILEYCLSNGWKVFIRFDLHAKTYIVDNSRGIIGSANMTASGLELKNYGNYEMASFVKVEKDDIHKIESLFENSIKVTDEIIRIMRMQYEEAKENGKNVESSEWSDDIKNLAQPKVNTLFSYDLPETDRTNFSYGEKITFLDVVYDGNIENIRNAFLSSNCYKWLINVLQKNDGCLYFGELSQKLHDSIVSDPKPYRKDVKLLLSNFLSWIQKFDIVNVVVDRPNHSQRVRLILNVE